MLKKALEELKARSIYPNERLEDVFRDVLRNLSDEEFIRLAGEVQKNILMQNLENNDSGNSLDVLWPPIILEEGRRRAALKNEDSDDNV
jgi:hypothetical protein